MNYILPYDVKDSIITNIPALWSVAHCFWRSSISCNLESIRKQYRSAGGKWKSDKVEGRQSNSHPPWGGLIRLGLQQRPAHGSSKHGLIESIRRKPTSIKTQANTSILLLIILFFIFYYYNPSSMHDIMEPNAWLVLVEFVTMMPSNILTISLIFISLCSINITEPYHNKK